MQTTLHAFATEDIDYLRHGGQGLPMRLFKPQGDGPFPTVIDLHGGAWTSGDQTECHARAAVLAGHGLVVATPNFRHGADGYPTSLADINYAIRWLKANARDLRAAPGLVGAVGQSSGGHLAMLVAMRPKDPRYAAIPLPAGAPAADASLACVAMLWPVINPLSRYRHAKRLGAGPNPPAWTGGMPERHDRYWGNEAAMAEGNPLLALERGETVETPPALWLQGRPDEVHDYRDPESGFDGNEPERFASRYRGAGGQIELAYIDNATRSSPATFERVAAFLRRHLVPKR